MIIILTIGDSFLEIDRILGCHHSSVRQNQLIDPNPDNSSAGSTLKWELESNNIFMNEGVSYCKDLKYAVDSSRFRYSVCTDYLCSVA